MKVNKNTIVREILKSSKEAVSLFKKYNLYCPGCKGSEQDTVEIAAANHGMDLNKLIKELNSIFED